MGLLFAMGSIQRKHLPHLTLYLTTSQNLALCTDFQYFGQCFGVSTVSSDR